MVFQSKRMMALLIKKRIAPKVSIKPSSLNLAIRFIVIATENWVGRKTNIMIKNITTNKTRMKRIMKTSMEK